MVIPPDKKLRAGIYYRVSGKKQVDAKTIDAQKPAARAYVADERWDLIAEFEDNGFTAKTGKLAKREGFAKLRAALEAGKLDIVVLVELDRITRTEDLAERGEILGLIQRTCGLMAEVSTRSILDLRTLHGDMMASIKAIFAAEENRVRAARSMRGSAAAVERHASPRGILPFGYARIFGERGDPKRGLLRVDDDEARLVRDIIRRVGRGESAASVGRDYRMRCVVPPRGGKWCGGGIANIVRNPVYYQGFWTVDVKRAQTIPAPTIVTEDEGLAANAALDKSGLRGLRRTKGEYLLETQMKCALCGAGIGIHIEVNKRRCRRRAYYQCMQRRWPPAGKPRCTLRMRQVVRLDERLWSKLVEVLKAKAAEVDFDREVFADDREAEAWAADVADLERKLADLAVAEDAILERFTRGAISAGAMDAHLARAAARRTSMERALEGARKARTGARGAVLAAAEALSMMRRGIDELDFAARRAFVEGICEGLTLYPDGAVKGNLRIRARSGASSGGACAGENDSLPRSSRAHERILLTIPLICEAA